jgi:hypothetical protein
VTTKTVEGMMGIIYQRGKVYYVDLWINGRRIRKRIGTSKKMAETVLKDLEIKVIRRAFDFEPADAPIAELFKSFHEYSQTNHAPGTYRPTDATGRSPGTSGFTWLITTPTSN